MLLLRAIRLSCCSLAKYPVTSQVLPVRNQNCPSQQPTLQVARSSGGAASAQQPEEVSSALLGTAQHLLKCPFRQPSLLHIALSKAATSPTSTDFAQMAWLGDAVLYFCSTETLLDRYPDLKTSELSFLRSRLVSRQVCTYRLNQLGVNKLLRKELAGRPNVEAEVFEALLGAICQDAGYDGVRAFLQRHWPLPRHHDQLRKDIQRAGLWPQLKRYQFGWDEATILEQNPEALQDVPSSIRDAPNSK